MSKQRNLRKSKLSFADEEDEEDGDNGSIAIPPAAVKAAQQKQLKDRAKAEKKSATLLSFEDGEEDGPGGADTTAKAISKGKSTNKPSLRIPPGSTVTLPAAATGYNTQVAAAGEYTAERLKELQSATQRAPRSTTQATGGAAGAMPLPPPLSGVAEDMDIEDEGLGASIPDQHAIRAAKAKREQLRSGGAPDYIDLHSAGGKGSPLEPFAAGMKGTSNKKIQDIVAKGDDVVMPAAAEDGDEEEEEEAWAE